MAFKTANYDYVFQIIFKLYFYNIFVLFNSAEVCGVVALSFNNLLKQKKSKESSVFAQL